MADCYYTLDSLSLTGDDVYAPRICDQPFIDYAWHGHGFNHGRWQDGWGYDDCCNVTKPLARTFNAIWLLAYSAEDWGDESWNSSMLHWGQRYVREQLFFVGDLRADCGDGTAYARTTGCQWTRSFHHWRCQEWRRDVHRDCASWHWLFSWICFIFTEIVSWLCLAWGLVSTAACTLWFGTVGGGQNVTLYLIYFYTQGRDDVRDVIARAGTLVHESRHVGNKPHDADFPVGSVYPAGGGADSSWSYEGAWMYHALYLWWFYAEGARTTIALRESAKSWGNVILANAFAQPTGFVIS